jgi:hypothetical protein
MPLFQENNMTLPDERYRALKQAKKLMEELCDPGRTPRVPSLIRDRARGALRHFPSDYELDRMAEDCPELLDKHPFNMYTNGKLIGDKIG